MFKKFKQEDVVTVPGRIEETIDLKLILFGGFRKYETHFRSGTSNMAYYLTILDGNTENPWSNKLATVAYGMHSSSALYTYTSSSAIDHKNKIYRLYAKTLLGDESFKFVVDKEEQNELIFISLNRNQIKDGIKPNTINLGFIKDNDFIITSSAGIFGNIIQYYSDVHGTTRYDYKGGTAGDLFPVNKKASSFSNTAYSSSSIGLMFYNHGTAVLIPHKTFLTGTSRVFSASSSKYPEILLSGNNELLYGICNKFIECNFVNYQNPQITFFNCIAEKEEFNYSSNVSAYNSLGEINVMSGTAKQVLIPTTYITQIGLCNDLGEVLAIAKSPFPIKKDFTKKLLINVRLIT